METYESVCFGCPDRQCHEYRMRANVMVAALLIAVGLVASTRSVVAQWVATPQSVDALPNRGVEIKAAHWDGES